MFLPGCYLFNYYSQYACLFASFHFIQWLLQLRSPGCYWFNYYSQYACLSASFHLIQWLLQLRSLECDVSSYHSLCACLSFHFTSFKDPVATRFALSIRSLVCLPVCFISLQHSMIVTVVFAWVWPVVPARSMVCLPVCLISLEHSMVVAVVFAWVWPV